MKRRRDGLLSRAKVAKVEHRMGVWGYGSVGGAWHNRFPLPHSHTPILPYRIKTRERSCTLQIDARLSKSLSCLSSLRAIAGFCYPALIPVKTPARIEALAILS